MSAPKKILYVTRYRDNDLNGLGQALRTAKRHGAHLTLASLRPELPTCLNPSEVEALAKDLQSVEAHRLSFVYSDLLSPAKKQGVATEEVVLTGIPFLAVIQYVYQHDIDLVVISNRWHAAEKTSNLGSTEFHLLRKCPCDVWVIQTERYPVRKVLAALDPLANRPLHENLLERALDVADQSAAETHVAHIWSLPGQELLESPLCEIDPKQVAAWRAEEEVRSSNALEELLRGHQLTRVWTMEGRVGPSIATLVQDTEADLLVMGTVNRTGLAGFIVGHHAEHLLTRVPCSIYAVKPDGFVSPVPPQASS